jgi:hypothetical protein
MNRPDLAAVLAAHARLGGMVVHSCACGWTPKPAEDHRAHLAAVLNAAVDAWLEHEETREAVSDAIWTENARLTMPEFRNMPDAEAKRRFATAALAALTQREDTP